MSIHWRVTVASPPDRERLVAEIFFGDVQWAELNQESDAFEVEFYPRPDGEPWRIPYNVTLAALSRAKESLSE